MKVVQAAPDSLAGVAVPPVRAEEWTQDHSQGCIKAVGQHPVRLQRHGSVHGAQAPLFPVRPCCCPRLVLTLINTETVVQEDAADQGVFWRPCTSRLASSCWKSALWQSPNDLLQVTAGWMPSSAITRELQSEASAHVAQTAGEHQGM